MRSIQRRFQKIQNTRSDRSTYTCFAEAVIGQSFSKHKIAQWFNHLVNKDDYSKSDKKNIIQYLCVLSNGHEEG